ncbi:MAG: hypothetical protein JSV17_14830, partial [Candidatus Aminicenantes bacterium]
MPICLKHSLRKVSSISRHLAFLTSLLVLFGISSAFAQTVSFTGTPYTNGETGTKIITVTLTGTSVSTVSVDYATSDGTATAPGDYTSTSGTLTWDPGIEGDRTFPVTIQTDTLHEGNENVVLTLSNPVNCTITGGATADLTIIDDDPEPTVSFTSATYSNPESGSAAITVSIAGTSASTVT